MSMPGEVKATSGFEIMDFQIELVSFLKDNEKLFRKISLRFGF